ncbi:hypothetical protein V8E51_012493 [Hyaloscypha variabilis]
MRKALIIIALLVSLASAGFYSDLLTSIFKSGKPSISTFVRGIPKDVLDVLETNEHAFENLAEELGSDVWGELTSGFADVTSFIESLPSLAPEVLNDILTDGEDVVSVVEELFTNPGAALTIIEGDVMTVVSDVESVVTGAWNDFTCFICGCCSSAAAASAAATTSLDPAASLAQSCSQINAAATTTYSPTDLGAAGSTSTAYPSAQPTNAASPTFAAQTTTQEQAAPTGQQTPGSGGGSGVPSDGALGYIFQAWVGLLTCFIVCIVVL